MRSAARRQPSTSSAVSPVARASAACARGSADASHSTIRVATSRFSFASRFVYALSSTTVVYSSGPVTAWMQNAPSRRSEKNPSSIQKRAVSTSTSAPCSSRKPRSPDTRL